MCIDMVIITAKSVPFRITFVSDTFEGVDSGGLEWDGTAASNNNGFKIAYTQS